MSGQLDTYNQEIFNFLRTVTIKFDAFAYSMGDEYMTQHGLVSPHFKENPYYQLLNGEYPSDFPRMTVTAVEDGSTIEFNKDLINNYPQTAALYRIPNKEFDILEEQYPSCVGLIRTIAYPIEDIDAAIAAPNLSLLACDKTLLETAERDDLVECIKEFLNQARTRWWVDAFVYEDLYPITFWAMLWQHLALLLLTRRFNNIRTPYAHSYHIWEYLQSRGLSDYRDILTTKQAAWLYRNIDYIHANRGKNQTLKLLAENLLPDVAVSLLYYDMYQETESRWEDQLSTNPMFRRYQLVDDAYVGDISFSDLNYKLYYQGMEERIDAEFVEEKELALARHGHNILPTKFLEFKKEPIDTRNEQRMTNFFLDTLFYRFSSGKLMYDCSFRDPVSNAEYKLSIADTILLWHYAMHRSVGEVPKVIPKEAVVWLPFKLKYPGKNYVNHYIYSNGHKFLQSSLLDLTALQNLIPWSNLIYTDAKDYMTNVVQQFAAYLSIIQNAEQSNKKEYHDALMVYLYDVTEPSSVVLDLSTANDFDEWIKSSEVEILLQNYEDYTEPSDLLKFYGALAKACFDALCPTTGIDIDIHINTNKSMETIYKSIRDLFIRLGSYNVFYLETERTHNEYITFNDPDFYCFKNLEYDFKNTFSWTHESYPLQYKVKYNVPIDDVCHDMSISNIMPHCDVKYNSQWDAGITNMEFIVKFNITVPVVNDLTNFKFIWTCSELPVDTGALSIYKE